MAVINGFRLSSQQERIWSQQAAGAAPFFAECSVRIAGVPDAGRLREAISSAVGRHEILRTVFQRQPGLKLPFQVIESGVEFVWRTLEIPEEGTAQIRTLVRHLQNAQDFSAGPLLIAVFAVLSPEKSILALSLPALCADEISLRNILAEIAGAHAQSTEAEDALQYADIVEWQEGLRTGEDTKEGREFWQNFGRNLRVNSPGFHAVAPGGAIGTISVQSSAVCERNFLLACWRVFLSRMTGEADLILGCTLTGRKYAELETAIGPFAAILPLRIPFDPAAPFRVILDETARAVLEAESWQESFAWPLLEIADAPETGPALRFGFDVSDLSGIPAIQGYTSTVLDADGCPEAFELRLSARPNASGMALSFHYDQSRFSDTKASEWLHSFRVLVESARPETPAGRIPILSEAQRGRLIRALNQTAAEFPRTETFHRLFEQQAARTPASEAVRSEDRSLTYAELNAAANRLAAVLRAEGVAAGSRVGLCLERGVDMIAALLGILKAGGAYVALSADHPKARLAQQLEGAAAVVTQQSLHAHLPEFSGPVVLLDSDRARLDSAAAENPESRTSPEDTAYVIYTSGSTGAPKGVAVRHRNLVNYAWFIARRLELDRFPAGLHFATVSTLGADLGNTCIFPSLISGGCLHVIPHAVSSDGEKMAAYNRRYPLDVLKIVPSHLTALLDSASEPKSLLPAKYLILGGEAFTIRLLDRLRSLAPSCELFNHYGPTETTVGSLTLRLRDYAPAPGAQTVPIGRPIANTGLYVLDANRELVPHGSTGELYIAGEGVTAGYLNLPERTAERFLPDPFASEIPGPMYRTGDLVRYLPDDNIEFLGRADDQVKIRGFRIEPGEIEAVLADHPAVRQAVVAARPDDLGGHRLIAWVAPQRGEDANLQATLREYLQKQLPDYMVPAAIVVLARLPLTPNGKIDRQNLPEPEAAPTGGYIAPRTPVEAVIAGIWAEVLKRDRVGVQDNFFEIGGHSLLATQVISRVRRSLEIDPPLRILFESPTVARLAEWIDGARRDGQNPVPPPIVRVSRDRPLPLSFAQQRLWVIDQLDPGNPMYNIPRTLRMKGELNPEALDRALNEIVRRHESQRTTFAVQDGQPVQLISERAELALPVTDLTELSEDLREEAARGHAREEALKPFDLAAGPLVRARLLRLAPGDHVLLLTAHHIVSDAWSAGLFFKELGALYEAFTQNKPSPLGEPGIQYADYAVWQREWLQGETLRNQLAYWREQLLGAPPVLALPMDRPRSQARTFEGSSEAIPFSPELTEALRALSRREDVTLFMTLLAGFQAFLSRSSGDEQIVVGTDLANRTTAEAEQLIGFFINVLPLRTDLSGNPTFQELLRRVRGVALGAYAHQDMPFDKIVEELQPERSSEHNPLVQALFVMQNTPAPPRELAGLELSGMGLPVRRSKFDLAVFMTDRGEQLVGHWVYRTELFDRETILKLASRYEALLESAASAPETRLNALAMRGEDERRRLKNEQRGRKSTLRSRLQAAEPTPVAFPALDEITGS